MNKQPKNSQIGIWLPLDWIAKLDEIAAQSQGRTSREELIRQAVEEWLAMKQAERT